MDQCGCQYRSVQLVSPQLLDHCTVSLEEQLYSQAFGLLLSALTSGTGTPQPAQIPPYQHLALAATLAVHPVLTTRTASEDKHAAADDALSYLQHAVKLLPPCDSGLDRAFQFVPKRNAAQRGSKRPARATRHSDFANDNDDDQYSSIHSAYVDEESLWQSADDFWSVLGWALNCSVAHKARWQRWKLLLELIVDTLDSDLRQRSSADSLNKSLLAQYLRPIGEGRNNKRRVMRAILADGKQKSLAEFGEIWRNETNLPKARKDGNGVVKKRKLDLENGEFGDYFDDESGTDSAASTRRSRSTTTFSTSRRSRPLSDAEETSEDDHESSRTRREKLVGEPGGVEAFGGIASVHLRCRLLALLVRYCTLDPHAFLDAEDLFDLYTEFLRPLPLAVFQQFVLPAKRWLGPHEQSSLDQMLLYPLLSNTALRYNENKLTQKDFELHYAPHAANGTSFVDNAKVSLLIEDLLRLLWKFGGLVNSEQLRRVVEEGIKARKNKAATDGRRKAGTRAVEDDEAKMMMEGSAERMLACLDLI